VAVVGHRPGRLLAEHPADGDRHARGGQRRSGLDQLLPNRDAMANPASLEAYVGFAKQWPTVEE
jgi:hypothetical protein